jgi:two-component system response regulator YesN
MQIKQRERDLAQQVKDIIDKQYFRHDTYEDLAYVVGTNPTRLQLVFKAVNKKNIYEYRTAIRLEKAMYFLENTELKIETIAGKVGLDRTNLNKQFKKVYGKSPSDYRLEKDNEADFKLRELL